MQYERLMKDDAEIFDDVDQDSALMPFELRVVEAALDVVSPLAVHFSCRLHSFCEPLPPQQ